MPEFIAAEPAIAERAAEKPSPAAVEEPGSEIKVRAEGLFRLADSFWIAIDRLLHRSIPPHLNPFTQLGGLANLTLIIAVVSGIALLLWYTPSVAMAYQSMESLRTQSWLGQFVRSMHRYSSDACMFLMLLHAARVFSQRRFTGARWLAWTSGVGLLALVWVVGWSGYFLVWDVRSQAIANGSVKFLDVLPIFAEPLSGSFLTNESVPSLLFFIVFFAHMLMPLGLGIGVWIHLTRLNRARLLTSKKMGAWVCLSLALLSLLRPALSGQAADLGTKFERYNVDWWYHAPLALTERFSGGLLWAVLLLGGVGALSLPWTLRKPGNLRKWRAEVDLARCIGCSLCAADCPFNAITMIPREDGRKFTVQSQVNLDLCVGCGICTGACDSQAINLPAQSNRVIEKQLLAYVAGRKAAGEQSFIAFVCQNSRATLALKGYKVQQIPCAGWLSAVFLEKLLQGGASGIMVVACSHGDPGSREGVKWFEQRMEGKREPAFNHAKASAARIRLVSLDSHSRVEIEREAARLRNGTGTIAGVRKRTLFAAFSGIAPSLAFCAIIYAGSAGRFHGQTSSQPELVVKYKHSGVVLEPKQLSKEELQKRLPHMRAQANFSRERASVRMQIEVDGKTVFDRASRPRGFSRDGASGDMARLELSPGTHHVIIRIADTGDPNDWTYKWEQPLEFAERRVRVVEFSGKNGFSAH